MPATALDHIVITAPDLASGAAFIRATLGVEMQPGGEHVRMGTHNLLLGLGPTCYLEVIAINPAAPPPDRPRWFALDQRAPDAPPALTHWVVRSPDIRASAANASINPGVIEAMSRGALNWQITIPADGNAPLDGLAPALIEWQSEPHPAARLPDSGLRLERLELHHPAPERLAELLQSLTLDAPLALIHAPAAELRARIATADGVRLLAR